MAEAPAKETPGTVSPPPAQPAASLERPFEAATGAVERITLKPGETATRDGAVYFLSVATGTVEGWVLKERAEAVISPGFFADNRWLIFYQYPWVYLTDRTSGATYRWPDGALALVAARGDHLLFQSDRQVWLSGPDLKRRVTLPVPTGEKIYLGGAFAPDGTSLIVNGGDAVYLVDTATGATRKVGEGVMRLDDTGDQWVTFERGGKLYRYGFDGKVIAELAGTGTPSPDGKWVATNLTLLDALPAVEVSAAGGDPRFRLLSSDTCNAVDSTWKADSSGLVVNTADGIRLLRTSGDLEPIPGVDPARKRADVIPAPDRADRLALNQTTVVDGSGRVLAEIKLGQHVYPGRFSPWGYSSDELRMTTPTGGKGYFCYELVFPPRLERGPFSSDVRLKVGLPAADCTNLRTGFHTDAPVVVCVPGGSTVSLAPVAGTMPVTEGLPETWAHVRTADGKTGWIRVDTAQLGWE